MLQNKSVLVVEDEFLIGQLLEDMLADLGCTNVSVATDVTRALDALEQQPDLVILDLNLDGESALPVAAQLRDHKIPFIISSGYDPRTLDAKWRQYPLLTKPYTADALEAKIAQALSMEKL